jgi:hypothetical protein
MPYLISTSPGVRTNRAPEDDIDRGCYINERERRTLEQARQSAARRTLSRKLRHPTTQPTAPPALGVTPDQFREAFRGVTPAKGRVPTGAEAAARGLAASGLLGVG